MSSAPSNIIPAWQQFCSFQHPDRSKPSKSVPSQRPAEQESLPKLHHIPLWPKVCAEDGQAPIWAAFGNSRLGDIYFVAPNKMNAQMYREVLRHHLKKSMETWTQSRTICVYPAASNHQELAKNIGRRWKELARDTSTCRNWPSQWKQGLTPSSMPMATSPSTK